jgi:3-methyladenine DNA glycosylase AlkD
MINEIRKELKSQADAKFQKTVQRFFKEKIKAYGVRSSVALNVAKKYFKQIKDKDKKEIFNLCSKLWQSGYLEESSVACQWAYATRERFEHKDFKTFEIWVKRYISNWAQCDAFCTHTMGFFVEKYPNFIARVKKWAKSENLWARRASAVSFIIPAKKGLFLKDIFEISDVLLRDEEAMVQKGYGWLLKAASDAWQKEVFDYVMKHKAKMPRTALRYAIEKMPKNLKKRAMVVK